MSLENFKRKGVPKGRSWLLRRHSIARLWVHLQPKGFLHNFSIIVPLGYSTWYFTSLEFRFNWRIYKTNSSFGECTVCCNFIAFPPCMLPMLWRSMVKKQSSHVIEYMMPSAFLLFSVLLLFEMHKHSCTLVNRSRKRTYKKLPKQQEQQTKKTPIQNS